MTDAEQQPKQDQGDMLAARKAALLMLGEILDRKQPLDQVLEQTREFTALPQRDRGFVRMLVTTTLRRLGQVDDFINKSLTQAEPLRPPALRNLLRLGATQIAFMNVPDYAIVDTSVRIAEKNNLSRQKGLVNAVLRRIADEHKDWEKKQDAARINTPEWLMKIWIEDYGLRIAAEIAQAHMSEAPLDISVKNPEELSYWEGTLNGTKLSTGTLRLMDGGQVQYLPGFDDGMWWVQDASAALPAKLLGDVEHHTVIDMCAAPGGKTAQLAAMGANVVALDRSTRRLKRLTENMNRLRLNNRVKVEAADASHWRCKQPPEYILLDAPCSATGTIRRHPDVMVLKNQIDMERLVGMQHNLLMNAADIMAKGGTLIYCTCSLQKAEGEHQIENFLNARNDMERVPIKSSEIGGLDMLITSQGDVRVLPFHLAPHGGMDGFFISRLVKR